MAVDASFDALADFYDLYTQEDDYGVWGAILRSLLEENGWRLKAGDCLLDLACGTGKSTEWLLGLGDAEVYGCDISRGMLAQASAKPALAGARFFMADMQVTGSLTCRAEQFQLVSCMDDSLNFVTEPDALASVFRNVQRALGPEGVFIFDTNSIGTYRTWYGETRTCRPNENVMYVWEGRCRGDFAGNTLAEADLSIFAEQKDGLWRRHESPHRQRYYSPDFLVDSLVHAGFTSVRQYGLSTKGEILPGDGEGVGGKTISVARVA